MIRKASARNGNVRTETVAAAAKQSAEAAVQEGFALYCTACRVSSNGVLQGAQEVLTTGFRDIHYRYHVKSNDWIADTEFLEGNGVDMADRPHDPATTTGVQLEVVLDMTEAEVAKWEAVRTHSIGIDWTGEPYRRSRQFYIPASVLNAHGRVRIMPPEEAFEKCSFRVAEADERGKRLKRKGGLA